MARKYVITNLQCVQHGGGILAVFDLEQGGQTLCNLYIKTGDEQPEKEFAKHIHLMFPRGKRNPKLLADRQHFEFRCTPEIEELIRLKAVEAWSKQQALDLKDQFPQVVSREELAAWWESQRVKSEPKGDGDVL